MKKKPMTVTEMARRGGLARTKKVPKRHLSVIGWLGAHARWEKARRGSTEKKSSQLRGS